MTDKNVERGVQSGWLRVPATIISYILHPVFMPVVMALVVYNLSPVSFMGIDQRAIGLWFIMIVVNTLFFPLLLIVLLKKLNLVKSIQMHELKDRIIPLIGIMVFYFWAFHVINNVTNNNLAAPLSLRVLMLGCFIGIIVTFLCSIFYKISMHTMAAGGMLGIIIVLLMISPVRMIIPLFIAIFVAGVSGTARLLLGAHTQFEIWSGYALGIISMLFAYWYLA